MPNPFKPTSKRRSSPRPFIPALILILITVATPLTVSSQLAIPHSPPTTSDLWIDLLIGPPLVPTFNNMARADDIARIGHHSFIGQLDGIIPRAEISHL